MANYIVQDTSLETVADAIRAKAGISAKLEFPLGWKAAVESISVGSAPDGSPFVVGLEINAGGSVSVTSEKWYDYMLFNGVRLPRIPADALAKYPYAWIQKNTVNGYYVLLLAPVKWYFANSVLDADCNSGGWYRLPISGAGEATAWEYYASISSGNYFSVDSDCPVLWANHDIPNGSATATEIYFAGSEPVPTD